MISTTSAEAHRARRRAGAAPRCAACRRSAAHLAVRLELRERELAGHRRREPGRERGLDGRARFGFGDRIRRARRDRARDPSVCASAQVDAGIERAARADRRSRRAASTPRSRSRGLALVRRRRRAGAARSRASPIPASAHARARSRIVEPARIGERQRRRAAARGTLTCRTSKPARSAELRELAPRTSRGSRACDASTVSRTIRAGSIPRAGQPYSITPAYALRARDPRRASSSRPADQLAASSPERRGERSATPGTSVGAHGQMRRLEIAASRLELLAARLAPRVRPRPRTRAFRRRHLRARRSAGSGSALGSLGERRERGDDLASASRCTGASRRARRTCRTSPP